MMYLLYIICWLSGNSQKIEARYVPGELIVKLRPGVSKNVLFESTKSQRKMRVEKVFTHEKIGKFSRIYKITFQDKSIDIPSVVKKYKSKPEVEYAEPNYYYEFYHTPNDPYYSSTGSWGQGFRDLWGLYKMQCAEAWDSTKGEGVIIGIIDTGIDDDHEDIQENIWINTDETPNNGQDDDNNGYVDDYKGYDFGDNDSDPTDDFGHGSHCAGIAAGCGDNGVGIVGVAYKAKVMNLKVSANEGSEFSLDGALKALKYAADNGAKVISNSWGGPYSEALEEAINYAYNKGCVIVAAAGNSASSNVGYPAGFENVICVSATDHNDSVTNWSNYGYAIDVAAPGGESQWGEESIESILSLRANDLDPYGDGSRIVGEKYYRMAGTSMSCPAVAGVCALILSKYPHFTQEQVRAALCIGSDDFGPSGWDPKYGSGRVNAYKAILQSNPDNLIVRFSSPSTYARVSGDIEIKGTAAGSGFGEYILDYGLSSEPRQWNTLTTSNSPITDGTLYTLDTRDINEGMITIRLTVKHKGGQYKRVATRVVFIQNKLQPGNWPRPLADTTVQNHPCYHTWFMSPTLADINRDGKDEIIIATGTITRIWWQSDMVPIKVLHVFDHTGQHLPGFPATCSHGLPLSWNLRSSPAVGDIDNDGYPEIALPVVCAKYVPGGTRRMLCWVYIWRKDGTLMSGWPKQLPEGILLYNGIVLEDLDNDKDLEIILGVNISHERKANIYIYHHDGSLMKSFEPVEINPKFWPPLDPSAPDLDKKIFIPAVGDIDNDGNMEIVAATIDGKIYAWKANGSMLPNFPIQSPVDTTSPPDTGSYLFGILESPLVLADLDKDNDLEIIIAYSYGGLNGGVSVYHHTGEIMSGDWPQEIENCVKVPVIGDIDGDNDLEIVVSTGNTQFTNQPCHIYVYHHNGTLVNGWPVTSPFTFMNSSSPLIVDINGTGNPEIIMVGGPIGLGAFEVDPPAGKLCAWSSDGNLMQGFPIFYEHAVPTPVIGNIDDDNNFELIVAPEEIMFSPITPTLEDFNGMLYAYDFGIPYLPEKAYWTTIYHDSRHTNRFEWPKPRVEEKGLSFDKLSLKVLPNPVIKENVEISYTIPSAISSISLKIYDISGREVWSMEKKEVKQGVYKTSWSKVDKRGRELGSGVYFIRLRVENMKTLTKKIVLMK